MKRPQVGVLEVAMRIMGKPSWAIGVLVKLKICQQLQ